MQLIDSTVLAQTHLQTQRKQMSQGCGCIPTELWALKSELHAIFTGHKIFYLNFLNIKKIKSIPIGYAKPGGYRLSIQCHRLGHTWCDSVPSPSPSLQNIPAESTCLHLPRPFSHHPSLLSGQHQELRASRGSGVQGRQNKLQTPYQDSGPACLSPLPHLCFSPYLRHYVIVNFIST